MADEAYAVELASVQKALEDCLEMGVAGALNAYGIQQTQSRSRFVLWREHLIDLKVAWNIAYKIENGDDWGPDKPHSDDLGRLLTELGFKVVSTSGASHGKAPAIPDISPENVRTAFDRFQALVTAQSGHAFQNFNEGMAASWESYKPRLREHALKLLTPDAWTEADIGSGKILNCTIEAIEIQDGQINLANNLCFWQDRYGHANRDHRILLEAVGNPKLRFDIEELIFGLYRDGADEEGTFDRLSDLSGGKYPLLAYLFFLKDIGRFMPIQPTGFDRAFRELGIEFRTLRQCSWENYSTFNAVLVALRPLIAEAAGLHSIDLIDAHSFCWILTSLMKMETDGTLASAHGKSSDGRIVGGRDRSIIELRTSIQNTVRQSNGQLVERRVKDKLTTLSTAELDKLIASLLEIQDNSCALTGIRFNYQGPEADPQLLPSPDRIDSDGHYEPGNIQIVCRFVNFWKGASDDAEFRRLLMLVRGDESIQ